MRGNGKKARREAVRLSIAFAAVDAYFQQVFAELDRFARTSFLLAGECEKELERYRWALAEFHGGNREPALRIIEKELEARLVAAKKSGEGRGYFQTAPGRRMVDLGAAVETIRSLEAAE